MSRIVKDRPKQRGACAECGEVRQLTVAGVMRDHRGDLWVAGWRQQCKGVGRPPSSIAPDPIVAAERRGYDKAIADLRSEAARLLGAAPESPRFDMFDSAAAFLECQKDGDR